mgnify:FL=1
MCVVQRFLYPPYHPNATYRALTTTQQWLVANDMFANNTFSDLEGTISFHDSRASAHTAPLQLVQYSGDVVIVPEEWSHSTYNRAPTIGVAHEVHCASRGVVVT